MEETRNSQNRYGMPVLRERSGHENVEDLFVPRRERQFKDGLMGETGYNSRYVLFRPASSFARDFGDAVLRLNDALYGLRRQAADHALFLEKTNFRRITRTGQMRGQGAGQVGRAHEILQQRLRRQMG